MIGTPAESSKTTSKKQLPQAAWLKRLNEYRAIAKLQPVVEDPTLSDADLKHTRYLVKNLVAPGPTAHDEDPANPWFSREG